MVVSWSDAYPSQRRLRTEVNHMVDAIVATLFEEIPKKEIEAIYFKGSAQKHWESPIDYVPELSDIDIHLLLASDSSVEHYLGSVCQALRIQAQIEGKYLSRASDPVHIPRPQLTVLNSLLHREDFIPSPPSAISVLYGRPYPQSNLSDPQAMRLIDARHLCAHQEFLQSLPLHLFDKPAKYLSNSLRALSWRVSPTGPQVLHLRDVPMAEAWGLNRTRAVELLGEMGDRQLAQHYSEFYLFGWEYFLSDYSDFGAARRAIVSAIDTISTGIRVARDWLGSHGYE